jgi:PDZ domain
MKWIARITALLLATSIAAGSTVLDSLERRIYQSFLDGDYPTAIQLIEEHLRYTPHDAVMLYNGACACSRLGERDRAAEYLRKAVAAGLVDLDQIERDPDLAAIRDHPLYRATVDRLRQAPANRGGDAMDRWRKIYGDVTYRYERDPQRHIAYATALDPVAHREMVTMIEREADQLTSTLFEAPLAGYLLVAVPTPEDGRRLFRDDRTGGIYEHELHRLIARDIGASLRHELVHAFHYADMGRVGQRHPLWVQEGLAALYESYVIKDDGSIVFLPNERHNVVRGLALAGRLRPWRELIAMTDDEFMADADHDYPEVRSIFEFLADRGQLVCWYRSLVDTFSTDPTGAAAFRACFHVPLADVERSWRQWVIARPPVELMIRTGDAALGIETRPRASNDGVLITGILPGSAAARSRLDVGDVIVAADGKATRTLTELQAVIASLKVGDSVTIRARREHEYFTVVVSLRPLVPIR